jgi:hypothetical protein
LILREAEYLVGTIKKGRCGTLTHDYKRNGTTTLFAAMDTLQGKVVGTATLSLAQNESPNTEIWKNLDGTHFGGSRHRKRRCGC